MKSSSGNVVNAILRRTGAHFIVLSDNAYVKQHCLAVVQLARITSNRVDFDVVRDSLQEELPHLCKSHLRKLSIRTVLCISFLRTFSCRYALASPTRRGSSHDKPVRYIEMCTFKEEYHKYREEWQTC